MDRPDGCQHFGTSREVPKDILKYWQQRYDLFSRYDEDIWFTPDSWFGVTPEAVADTIAMDIARAASPSKTVLIDAFAGIGGNTIAFARSGRWDQIFAIEMDEATLKCAKHNAAVYGVEKKIFWIKGNCFDVLKKQLKTLGKTAVIFGSPPWGGQYISLLRCPGYRSDEVFNLSTMQPYNLATLCEGFAKTTKEVVLFLPRTSDLKQVADVASGESQISVTHYCMHGASKALCVYLGLLPLE